MPIRLRSLGATVIAGALLSATTLAQPAPPREPMDVVIRCYPPGALVYAEAVSSRSNLLYLGRCNEAFTIDRTKFRQGITLHIGGALPDGAQAVPGYRGYRARTDTLAPALFTRNLSNGVMYFPSLDESEVLELRPASGVGPWFERILFALQLHPLMSLALIIGVAGLGVGGASVAVRYRALKEEREKIDRFNQRLHSLNVQNDVFLARQFGEWATVKRLGQGGMAVVYKGVSSITMDDSQAVAVKVMNPELASDPEYRRRFNREIQISRTLDHPNVVRMIDFGEQDGVLFLVMEYIEGATLRDSLPEKGFPLVQAMDIALGIAHGLIHAHHKGIVHRDLKPDNVMMTVNGLIKVMDLGLAKREESENVTRTGDTFGTPAYMAPEQIAGGALVPATDQYAFGVMLFEVFTGRRPFDIADSLTLVMKHLQEAPPLVREIKSQLPEELELVINRMLEKDPARRFKSLVDVQVELTRIQRKYCPK